MGMRTTLLLDTHYRPMGLIEWQKAITLLIQEKAEILKESDVYVRSVAKKFNVPKVLRLLRKSFEKYHASFSRRGVYLRDKGICAYCETQLTFSSCTLDHIIPTSRGGANEWLNVVAACKSCNGKKGARTPTEAGMKLNFNPRVPSRFELIRRTIEATKFKKLLNDYDDGT
jgi:5-methylcytosine-specific restriction endonuclease McrA